MAEALVWSGAIALAVCTWYRTKLRSTYGRQHTSPIRGSRTAMVLPLVVMAIMWSLARITARDDVLAWVVAVFWGLTTLEAVKVAKLKRRPV
ncbi:hypothetical protein ACFYZB_30695 [Streptomyces sp. NPDC001852]|uniref:hypothetical protein n=1 Tax=Streptomyces sp. NPDC001852 TaxID=3364619 RepID=UPI0036772C59